jgi:hypothetical protein
MKQVFISYVEEDSAIAVEVARDLESSGYSAWYYERDSIPGLSYMLQIAGAIEESAAVALIVSVNSLSSRQITNEVVHAHESGKPLVPLLVGMSHVEFQSRQPEWRQAVGASTSIRIPPEGIHPILSRIVAGLEAVTRDEGDDADKMLYAFLLPSFLLAWVSNAKTPGEFQRGVDLCCRQLGISRDRLSNVTNMAGEIEDPGLLRHLPAVTRRYLAVGTTIAQACGTLQLRDGVASAGADWRQMVSVAQRRACQQAEGLFSVAVLAALDEAFALEDPAQCLGALREWYQMASATLGSDANQRRSS